MPPNSCGETRDDWRNRSLADQLCLRQKRSVRGLGSGRPREEHNGPAPTSEGVIFTLEQQQQQPASAFEFERRLEAHKLEATCVTIRISEAEQNTAAQAAPRSACTESLQAGPSLARATSDSGLLLAAANAAEGALSDGPLERRNLWSQSPLTRPEPTLVKSWASLGLAGADLMGAHLERLEQMSSLQLSCGECSTQQGSNELEASEAEERSGEQLHSYAKRLSHLYQSNQSQMDASGEFRSLLYNIICCLLQQDDRVLATRSVGKLLGVIGQHLDSNQGKLEEEQQQQLAAKLAANQADLVRPKAPSQAGRGANLSAGRPSSRAANLRRISSVSYNDEQLIRNLCTSEPDSGVATATTSGRSNSLSSAPGGRDSPWAYEALASARSQLQRRRRRRRTERQKECRKAEGKQILVSSSLSSVELREPSTSEMLHLQVVESSGQRLGGRSPSCSSASREDTATTTTSSELQATDQLASEDEGEGLEEEECSSLRRADLEWTLNKLINLELKQAWLSSGPADTLKRAIRKLGVPNELRAKVWLLLIEQTLGDSYEAPRLLDEARGTIERVEALERRRALAAAEGGQEEGEEGEPVGEQLLGDEVLAILKQIELDVNRTMPGHRLFDDGAEGGVKLKRILVAYSVHVNREIG